MKNFFYLQRNDRNALIALTLVFVLIMTLIIAIGNHDEPQDSNTDSTYVQTGNHQYHSDKKEHSQQPIYYKVDEVPHELFAFDPNTADSTTLLRLGLQPWQVRSIYHYRAKGGIYRVPEDFARLYGLTKKQFEILRPYIRIGEDYLPAANYYGRSSYQNPKDNNAPHLSNSNKEEKIYSYPQKIKLGEHICINTADTTELKKIPGIGSGYAKTIVRYREQLGGFVSISQLKEIDGFPDGAIAYAQIKEGSTIKKLNINKLSVQQLRKHPYIDFYQAREICEYRRLKGPIKSLNALSLLKDFPPAEIERLAPYICFE